MKAKRYYFAGFLKDYEGILRPWTIAGNARHCQLPIADCQFADCQLPICRVGPFGGFVAEGLQIGNRQLAIGNASLLSVVLLEFPIERFAADTEGTGGVRLVAGGVVERGFDGLALDLFHR